MLLPLLASCVTKPPPSGPREFLDESNGSTLFIAQAPIVFARARTDVAANARDYATLVTVLEDRSGKYQLWLIAHRWSTVDPRFGGSPRDAEPHVQLQADDRAVSLEPTLPAPGFLEHRQELFTPHGAQSGGYRVDAALLRYLVAARILSLHFRDDAPGSTYTLWQDERGAMQAIVTRAAPR